MLTELDFRKTSAANGGPFHHRDLALGGVRLTGSAADADVRRGAKAPESSVWVWDREFQMV